MWNILQNFKSGVQGGTPPAGEVNFVECSTSCIYVVFCCIYLSAIYFRVLFVVRGAFSCICRFELFVFFVFNCTFIFMIWGYASYWAHGGGQSMYLLQFVSMSYVQLFSVSYVQF